MVDGNRARLAKIYGHILGAKEVLREVPKSREQALVMTKIEEAELWMSRLVLQPDVEAPTSTQPTPSSPE